MQGQRDESFDADGAPAIRRRERSRPGDLDRGSSPWRRVIAGVIVSSGAVALGVMVWAESIAVAIGWFLIAVVALTVPVTRARRLMRARRMPDAVTAGRVLAILTGLDEVEHRAVELGRSWPRLSVGPTGVLVIDVCPAGATPGPARRADTKVLRGQLARTARTGRAARRALDDAGVDIPVQTLAVTSARTSVSGAGEAARNGNGPRRGDEVNAVAGDVRLIHANELSGALSAGPVLPMAVVDAAFTSLTRTDRLVTD